MIMMMMMMMRSKGIFLGSLHLFLLLSFAPYIFGQTFSPYSLNHLCNNEKNFSTQGIEQLLQNLKPNTSFPDYATASNETLSLYALLQCRRDLPAGDCAQCFGNATTEIKNICPQQVDAMIWFDGCFLRYNNQSFFSKLDTDYYFGNPDDHANATFVAKNNELMRTLACEAQSNGKRFARGSINFTSSITMYGLVQCNQDLSIDDCTKCLQVAVDRSVGPCQQYYGFDCSSKIGRIMLMKNCYTQFDLNQFYMDGSEGHVKVPSSKCNFTSIESNGNGGQGKGRSNKTIYYVLGGAGGGLLFLILFFFIIVIINNGRKRSPSGLPSLLSPINENDSEVSRGQLPPVEMEIFSWDVIVSATNNFSIENKLGEGGYGIVYLGKLVNGREIAVKRLMLKSDHERKDFLNEVDLVAKLQHRNLNSLVGCCIEGQERLLIYEYMPNSSLDRILFDQSKKSLLNWDIRFELIMGIGRGLLYLHEDSSFHVIHRDIKAANVLLDNKLRPKISDFGMAHLFSVDQSVVATRVAGTFGYMAPEYVMHGMLSTKVDIYSYGVLVLEIISGRRNNDPTLPLAEDGIGLVGWAHELQKEGSCLELVDPYIGENWSEECMLRCIHVALLCTENMSSKRPSISTVLMMLSSNSATLPIISGHSSSFSSTTNQTDPLLLSSNDISIKELSSNDISIKE